MEFPRSPTVTKWWPLAQSLDLIEGSSDHVAAAIEVELSRIVEGEEVRRTTVTCTDLDSVFALAPELSTVPTMFVVVPTHSKWSILWVNSALCDGYDALCHCLTANHGLTTLHWSAHDDATTFQPGAGFTFRSMSRGGIEKRSVQSARNDGRWVFVEIGAPLPEEDISLYSSPQKRERLNESSMQALLERLGARPWRDDFYALPGDCHVVARPNPPASVKRVAVASVLGS